MILEQLLKIWEIIWNFQEQSEKSYFAVVLFIVINKKIKNQHWLIWNILKNRENIVDRSISLIISDIPCYWCKNEENSFNYWFFVVSFFIIFKKQNEKTVNSILSIPFSLTTPSKCESFIKVFRFYFRCFLTSIWIYFSNKLNYFIHKFFWFFQMREMTWILKKNEFFLRLEFYENLRILLLSACNTHELRLCSNEDSSRTLPKTVFYFIVENILSRILKCFQIYSPCQASIFACFDVIKNALNHCFLSKFPPDLEFHFSESLIYQCNRFHLIEESKYFFPSTWLSLLRITN